MDTPKLSRRTLLQALASALASPIVPGSEGWLEQLALQKPTTLTPQLARMVAWEHLLVHGDLNLADSLDGDDSPEAQVLRQLVPKDYHSVLGRNTPSFDSAEFVNDLRFGKMQGRFCSDALSFLCEKVPMPRTPQALVALGRQLLDAETQWHERMRKLTHLTVRYPNEVRQALTEIDRDIFKGDLSEYSDGKEDWRQAWDLDYVGGLDVFNATPEAIDAFHLTLSSRSDMMAELARCVGLKHVDVDVIEPEKLIEIREEVADPNWRSIYDGMKFVNGDLVPMDQPQTLVVTTGGTIESRYSPEEATPHMVPLSPNPADTCIQAALERMSMRSGCDIYPVAMKDSKQVTTQVLDHILWYAAEHGYERIVIVHGTDTMPVHARYLKQRLAEWGDEHGVDQKTFIFTGSMTPLRDKHGKWRNASDGFTNLEKALEDAKSAEPGVYIEMGDGPIPADQLKKHVETKQVAGAGGKPNTVVSHAAFERDDPARHVWIGFH